MISAADKVNVYLSVTGWKEITVSCVYSPGNMRWVWNVYVNGEDKGLFLHTDKEPDTMVEITAVGNVAVEWYIRFFDGGEENDRLH